MIAPSDSHSPHAFPDTDDTPRSGLVRAVKISGAVGLVLFFAGGAAGAVAAMVEDHQIYAKGVALVNLLPGKAPVCVVDSNPAKQGGVLPGSKVPIVAPDDPRLDRLGLILIANPNYATEIRAVLGQRGFTGCVLTL